MHCSFLPATDKLLELFKKKCRTKVIKSSSRRVLANCSLEAAKSTNSILLENQDAESSVRMRHGGVLGLCAFISAYPYDIPDFVPDVFEHLGAHLNDPQPIPVCRSALCFAFRELGNFNFSFLLSIYSQPFGKPLAISSAHITTIGLRIS